MFITSTNDACFIQDPRIWCRNRWVCCLSSHIVFFILCYPKVSYLFTHGIIFILRRCNILSLWFWTAWWGTLLFPWTNRFLLVLRAHLMMMRCWVVMNQKTLWMMTINLMMTWTCQEELRTRGNHMTQVHHLHRFLILMFHSKKLLILDKMMILHPDMILLMNQLEFKGNTDRFLLILLMLYQRQRLRWLSKGQRFN